MDEVMHSEASWTTVRTAADCARRIEAIFGADLGGDAGVVHVTAAVRDPGSGSISALRVGPRSPRSTTDAFVLALARARADAIVTTGRILRAEPDLTHALAGPAEHALAAWRRETLGKPRAPISVVLTGRADLDLEHPLLRHAERAILWTTEDVAAALRARAVPENVAVIAHPDPSLRAAVAGLERGHGARTVVVEAGPHSSKALYEEPAAIDELLLSLFEGGGAGDADLAGVLTDVATLGRVFPGSPSEHRSLEESGPWRFLRFRRARGQGRDF